MFTTLRRIALVLASSSGLVAATTLTAQAGVAINHCEPHLGLQTCDFDHLST